MSTTAQERLMTVPLTLAEANAFVRAHHRHHGPIQNPQHKFSIGVADEGGTIRGVAIICKPASRARDDGWTAEVARVATDGCPNACSALYGAAWRAAKAMGYQRLGTYTLTSEPGTSLRAAGWRVIHRTTWKPWNRPDGGRPRVDILPGTPKLLWEAS